MEKFGSKTELFQSVAGDLSNYDQSNQAAATCYISLIIEALLLLVSIFYRFEVFLL